MEEKIICSRCGAEMKKSQRCCIKCGNINYNHPDNASMLKFADNGVTNSYVVGKGNLANSTPYVNQSINSRFNYAISSKAGSKLTCVIFNVFLYILLMFAVFFKLYNTGDSIADVVLSLDFARYLLAATYVSFTLLSINFIYMKANKPWWSFYVPFYGLYIYYDIILHNGWLFFLSLIPSPFLFITTGRIVPSPIIGIFVLYNLGKRFGYSGILTVLFAPIMIIVIGFNTASCYDGVYYVSGNNNSSHGKLTSDYKINKIVFTFFGTFFLIGLTILAFWYYKLFTKVQENEALSKVALEVVNEVKNDISMNKYVCDGEGNTNRVSSFCILVSKDNVTILQSEKYKNYKGYVKINSTNFYITLCSDAQCLNNASESMLKSDKPSLFFTDVKFYTVPSFVTFCYKNSDN